MTLVHLNNTEDRFKKCLELDEELVDKECMATDCGYLRTICQFAAL